MKQELTNSLGRHQDRITKTHQAWQFEAAAAKEAADAAKEAAAAAAAKESETGETQAQDPATNEWNPDYYNMDDDVSDPDYAEKKPTQVAAVSGSDSDEESDTPLSKVKRAKDKAKAKAAKAKENKSKKETATQKVNRLEADADWEELSTKIDRQLTSWMGYDSHDVVNLAKQLGDPKNQLRLVQIYTHTQTHT